MSILSSMEMPTVDVDLGPEKIEDGTQGGPMFHCDLCDTEVVHKLAQMFLPGLASACVDNTSGDLFKNPGSVAVDLRKEMIEYLTQRSESFVAESVILEGGPDGVVSDHPFDIISNFVDDFASLKRNLFSRVSGWLLSEKREDKIDDFIQEMEMNGFWTLERRESIAETFLKNVDFQNSYHCNMSFNSAEELADHVDDCNFRSMICQNEGCNARFCAAHLKNHDSTCPFKIILCEQKCSASIMRREMDRHCITVCPMKLVNCPFHAVGCRSAVAQCMIENHRSDDIHSHLWHLLKGIYKEASGEDLTRRVEQIVQASSSSRLAEARDIRSLKLIVKDIEAKLGPLEVSAVEENSAETAAKDDDREGNDTNKNGSEESTQASDMVNSSDKAKASDMVNMVSAENTAKNEDTKPSDMVNMDSAENTAKNEETKPSDMVSMDSAENTAKNEDTKPRDMVNMDSAENTAKNEDTKPSDMVNMDSAENIAKNEDTKSSDMVNTDSVENTANNEDTKPSHVENKGCAESTQTSNTANLSDKAEIGLLNGDSAEIKNENKDTSASELKIKGNQENTQTNMENLANEEISAINEGSAENSIKSRYDEDSKFEDKDNEQSIQNSKMETKGSAENNVKSKDIEDDNSKKSIHTSEV